MNNAATEPPLASKIRIAHLLTSIRAGGLEQFVLTLHDAMPSQKYEWRVYSWMGDDPWIEEFLRRGIRVRSFRAPNRLKHPSDFFQFCRAWIELVHALRDDQIDILQTHDFLPSLIGRTASILAGVRYRISTLHNLYDWWPDWAFFLNRRLARWTTATVCVSESVREYFIKREGLPAATYRTILNAANSIRFQPSALARESIRMELGISPKEIIIGCVGSITTRKAQHLLIKAVAPLINEGIPITVCIWGANQDSPQHAEKELRATITQLGIQKNVCIFPPRRDIERIYAALDIHCMPSIAEGLSLASIEAILSGALAIYSDIGPFKEVVSHGETGFLFESGNSTSLELTFRQVIPNLIDFHGIRNTARERIITKFSLQKFVRQWSQCYDQQWESNL